MKLKEWIQFLGFKPKRKSYGSICRPIEEEGFQHLKWSEWQHPKVQKVRPRFDDIPTLRKLIKPGDFVIDIGAHVGDTTLPYAHLVGKEGACLALEPNPFAYKILEENAQLNKAHLNIIPLQAAAAEREEILTFSYNDPGYCNGGNSDCYSFWERKSFFEIEVQGIDLEKHLNTHFRKELEKLRFIKTDVEGYDYILFKRLMPLIEKHRPLLQVEVYGKLCLDEKRAFADSIKKLNYSLFTVPDVSLSSMRPVTENDLKATKTFDLFAVPKLEGIFTGV